MDRQRRQKKRKIQTGKEHLLGNLKDSTSRGMKDDGLSIWKKLCYKSQQHSAKLMQNQPNIVTRLNERNREENEKEIQRKEKEKAANGEWHCNGSIWHVLSSSFSGSSSKFLSTPQM